MGIFLGLLDTFLQKPLFKSHDHARIVSRLLTLEYESKICKQAYPPGKHFVVPSFPNISAVNALGDFDIAADRLAIIDGEGTLFSSWVQPIRHEPYLVLSQSILGDR